MDSLAAADQLFVLDTSAIATFKQRERIPLEHQWAFLRKLEEAVSEGRVFFPRLVVVELTDKKRVPHPDAPGVWAIGMRNQIAHAYRPSESSLFEVMQRAGDVVDPEDAEDADPHVLAQALDLRDASPADVFVVSQDTLGGEDHISLREACRRFVPSIGHMAPDEFIVASGCLPPGLRP